MTAPWHDCEECGGEGFRYANTGPSGANFDCPECDGEGGWPDDSIIAEHEFHRGSQTSRRAA